MFSMPNDPEGATLSVMDPISPLPNSSEGEKSYRSSFSLLEKVVVYNSSTRLNPCFQVLPYLPPAMSDLAWQFTPDEHSSVTDRPCSNV